MLGSDREINILVFNIKIGELSSSTTRVSVSCSFSWGLGEQESNSRSCPLQRKSWLIFRLHCSGTGVDAQMELTGGTVLSSWCHIL